MPLAMTARAEPDNLQWLGIIGVMALDPAPTPAVRARLGFSNPPVAYCIADDDIGLPLVAVSASIPCPALDCKPELLPTPSALTLQPFRIFNLGPITVY